MKWKRLLRALALLPPVEDPAVTQEIELDQHAASSVDTIAGTICEAERTGRFEPGDLLKHVVPKDTRVENGEPVANGS